MKWYFAPFCSIHGANFKTVFLHVSYLCFTFSSKNQLIYAANNNAGKHDLQTNHRSLHSIRFKMCFDKKKTLKALSKKVVLEEGEKNAREGTGGKGILHGMSRMNATDIFNGRWMDQCFLFNLSFATLNNFSEKSKIALIAK